MNVYSCDCKTFTISLVFSVVYVDLVHRNFVKMLIKYTILNDFKKRKYQMSIILSKTSALDLRYHELKFLSDDQKTSVWEQY